jgi:hypothetical protein
MATDPLREVEVSFAEPIAAEDSVVFSVAVFNRTGSTIEVPLYGPGDWALDVEIRTGDDELVWRRLTGYSAFPGVTRLLASGKGFELKAAWDLRKRNGTPVPPGTYSVRAFLTAGDGNRREASPARSITVPASSG